ncbi:Uncharacterised protein [uncultured archaeon]|nr:Uncharacterised protein [uncultured archaeon]
MIWFIVLTLCVLSVGFCYAQVKRIQTLDVPNDIIKKARDGDFGLTSQLASYIVYG